MADGMVVLPDDRARIPPREGMRSGRLGTPLPQRPPDMPGVVIDIGQLGAGEPDLEVGDDGSISFPAVHTDSKTENANFGENLANDPRFEGVLGGIAAEINEGVTADEQSRSPWIEQYNAGLDLLGTKIERVEQSRENRQNVSRANEAVMLEAIVRYGAGARGELCPANGPVKVPTIGQVTPDEEVLAKAFQDDFNYYLTDVAKEYYPDTASMLTHQAFCGLGYKKVYRCPIRRRPVSESVIAPNLIVSEEATDLDSALRVTHQIEMIRSAVRRMQIVGQYRDVALGSPQGSYAGGLGAAQRKLKEGDGVTPQSTRPQDIPYLIWECDTDLDLDVHDLGLGSFERRAPAGLPLPYKVTIEVGSQQVLGLWRNWRDGDKLYRKRNGYVKFGLIPSLGFHSWGFLHLLGNQTTNLRSILRLLITAGMFANFPGGLKGKGVRTSTNEMAPRPGEFVDVDLPPGADITKAVMPLPYKGPDAVFVQLYEMVKQDAMRLGGTVMLEVGEGRTNVPIGTVLAMIEQQVQVMAGVHKDNHRAQKEELVKLRELFADDPEQLWLLVRDRPRSTPEAQAHQWRAAAEFMDLNLQPASDPNVPAQVHRVMLANVLIMLAQQNPQIYDLLEVHRTALQAIGADPDRYLLRPDQQAPPAPDPKALAATMKLQQQQQENVTDAQTEAAKLEVEKQKIAADLQKAAAENVTARSVAQMKQQTEDTKAAVHANMSPSGLGTPPVAGT